MNPSTSNPQLSSITEKPKESEPMAIDPSNLMQIFPSSDQAIKDSNLVLG